MTIDHDLAPSVVRDELRGVVAVLCARHPELPSRDVQQLVTEVYQQISRQARIHTHLIPLTLNRCRRLLSELENSPDEDRASPPDSSMATSYELEPAT